MLRPGDNFDTLPGSLYALLEMRPRFKLKGNLPPNDIHHEVGSISRLQEHSV